MQFFFVFSAPAALLAACASDVDRTGASAPTVTYNYTSEEEYREAMGKAEDYCGNTYDGEAHPTNGYFSGGSEETFVRSPD